MLTAKLALRHKCLFVAGDLCEAQRQLRGVSAPCVTRPNASTGRVVLSAAGLAPCLSGVEQPPRCIGPGAAPLPRRLPNRGGRFDRHSGVSALLADRHSFLHAAGGPHVRPWSSGGRRESVSCYGVSGNRARRKSLRLPAGLPSAARGFDQTKKMEIPA
jgi:hypothetical protein